jgi:hypothetical protein
MLARLPSLAQNSRQLGALRRGAGPRPAAGRSRRTVLGGRCTPSFNSSPLLQALRLEEPSERREESAIGCSERRPRLLSTKHQQLMP